MMEKCKMLIQNNVFKAWYYEVLTQEFWMGKEMFRMSLAEQKKLAKKAHEEFQLVLCLYLH